MLIQPESRNNNLYPVIVDGLYGYINSAGEVCIDPSFRFAGEFCYGTAPVFFKGGTSGYIDIYGNILCRLRGMEIIYPVRSKWGLAINTAYLSNFVSQDGGFLFSDWLDGASEFSGGYAITTKEKCSIIDESGKAIFDKRFDYVSNFSEGFFVYSEAGFWGLLDEQGAETRTEYRRLLDVSEGLVGALKEGVFGFIDPEENVVIDFQFDNVTQFKNKLAGVRSNSGLWGFIDYRGEVVIDFSFDEVSSFSFGLAQFKHRDLWGLIDSSGQIVVPAFYDKVEVCDGEMIRVERGTIGFGGEVGYFNLFGETIWEFHS